MTCAFITDTSMNFLNIFQSLKMFIANFLSAARTILGTPMASLRSRRRLEETIEELKKRESHFKLIVESARDYAMYMLDESGHVVSWNIGAERINGYKADEIVGQHISTFFTPRDLAAGLPEKELRMAREHGRYEGEGLRVRKNGSIFWANVIITPAFKGDQLTGYVKITRDITIKMKYEEQQILLMKKKLHSQEDELRLVANAMPVIVAHLDANERFLFVNDACAKWFNHTPTSIIGKSLKEVVGSERHEFGARHLQSVLSGKTVMFEMNVERNGKDVVIGVTYIPDVKYGDVRGFVLVATDITHHKLIESELKAAKEAADSANRAKSAFLANMSHEIRTPLGAVLGYSELMISADMSRSEKVNSVEAIKRNGRILSNIINDILDLAKVEAGKLEIEKIQVPFDEILTDLTSLLNLEATGKGIRLTVKSDGLVPQFITTDPLRLRQILVNVVGNAIKFTDHGEVNVRIRMTEENKRLAFEVQDTGPGIPSEKAEKLFTPFMQADPSMTRRFGGTGLGLAISKKLANTLGGDLVLSKTKSGVGSTFVVTIDCGAPDTVLFQNFEVKSKINVGLVPPTENFARLGALKVLLVEDSSDNCYLVSRILKKAGVDVTIANNGREGVQQALAGDFDLILMDIQMPEMDGFEATKELRNRGYKKPIIALTAHAMKEERQQCLESGFDDHLSKPIDQKMLLHALAKYSA